MDRNEKDFMGKRRFLLAAVVVMYYCPLFAISALELHALEGMPHLPSGLFTNNTPSDCMYFFPARESYRKLGYSLLLRRNVGSGGGLYL